MVGKSPRRPSIAAELWYVPGLNEYLSTGQVTEPELCTENLDTADLEPNGGPPITLEPSDTGPAIRWPKINKRPRDENADSGQRVLQQSTGNQYGRKPRRKTRDDKYEYKRPNSPKERRPRSHKNKGKRTRTSRKHTMNDAFHASNVARERLTVSDGSQLLFHISDLVGSSAIT